MPTWVWVLCALTALLLLLAILALALFRVRYFLEWRGRWDGAISGHSTGSMRIQYGFPGFLRDFKPESDPTETFSDLFDSDEGQQDGKNDDGDGGRKSAGPSREEPGFSECARNPVESDPAFLRAGADRGVDVPPPRPDAERTSGKKGKRDPNRARRALFRLVTDPLAWKLLGRYGLTTARLLFRLLKPRIEVAVGHPDPAFLGRTSGKWYAARPFLPFGRYTQVYFRFQDRDPSLWIKVQGSFSALAALGFAARLLIAFPSLRLARRALHGWRRHRLTGWRAWVYRRLQSQGA